MYQTEWQGIKFSNFIQVKSRKLADSNFYQAYYQEFFKRYQSWDQLDPGWRKDKERCAKKIIEWTHPNSKILSIGCGSGYMEHYIHNQKGVGDLFIHEVAPLAWKWIESEFPEDRKFLGFIPGCLPQDIYFDLIYLSAVDYAIDNASLVKFLSTIRNYLNGGKLVIISASFQETPVTLIDKLMWTLRHMKDCIISILDYLGLYSRGQFWGWLRTKNEYYSLLKKAGYTEIKDGFVNPDTRLHYWISGR
ncbi:MAG: methyltransferase domain-containing protein [Deltaproteobacteria bacterium]|nr:MAG: methyltransferase domain-containing protein [Deltaproteobacteria bacterium]